MKKENILKREAQIIEKEFGLVERKLWNFVFHFQYRKLSILVIAAILAYIIFRNPNVQGFVASLGQLEYFGVFIAGMFFTFGFTTPFAVGFFVILNPANPLLVACIGYLVQPFHADGRADVEHHDGVGVGRSHLLNQLDLIARQFHVGPVIAFAFPFVGQPCENDRHV
jgi:hypothetical protein